MASITSYVVETVGGFARLESQGWDRVPHLKMGGIIRMSYHTLFGQWDVVLVVTVWRCSLVCNVAQ